MDRETAGELQDKIVAYQDLLGKDPHSMVFVSLSDAWRQLGMLTEAINTALQGIQTLPKHGPGHVALARAQAESGALDAAEKSLARALELDPESAFALEHLARLRLLRGQRDQALALLERAARQAQAADNPVPANLLRSLRSAAPGFHRAPTQAEREAPIVTATAADLYVRQGHLQQAREVYQALLEAHPGDDSLRERLAAVDEKLAAAEAPGGVEAVSEAAPVETAPTTPEGPRQTVVVLRRWLEAIQRRREHVQGYSSGHC
jgi:tetratricopeptide (TPR) repeat protein